MLITQLLEWLSAVIFGPRTPGRHSSAYAPPAVPQAPTPYVVGARLVDVATLRAQRATPPPRPLPGPHWALPPAAWENGPVGRPYVAHLGAPPPRTVPVEAPSWAGPYATPEAAR
ncbi:MULTISPECIES: hypothetical protein [unclassified Streptomyces]|uniref:hypothetical protein n=1 Tax=unclassified Streptomyces TaxID=2593676 RepID=UPI0035E39981